MCKRKDAETEMVQVRHKRHRILSEWYPADIRGPKQGTYC